MVPIGDLMNHKNPPDIDWDWMEDKQGRKGYFMHAVKDIEKG